MQIDAGFLKI